MSSALLIQRSALVEKRAELAALRSTLADREEAAADLRNNLRHFETRYLSQVGVLYAELDDLEAHIAEHEVSLYKTEAARRRADDARSRANETREAAFGAPEDTEPFDPPADLKSLFREVARRIHPDFALDAGDAIDRTRLMARANQAYSRGDAEALQRILDDHHEAAARPDESAEDELRRIDRQIAHATRDIAALDAEIAELPQGDIAQLKTDADAARLEGRDLLAELATTLRERIANAQHRLTFVTRQVDAFDR